MAATVGVAEAEAEVGEAADAVPEVAGKGIGFALIRGIYCVLVIS